MTSSTGTNNRATLDQTALEDASAREIEAPLGELSAQASGNAFTADGGEHPSLQPEERVVEYRASIYQTGPIPPELGNALTDLSKALGDMPVWLLIQNDPVDYGFSSISETIADLLFLRREELKADQPVAVVIDSPGGDARGAYRIATMLRKQSGGFLAVVPRMAKSAATMLAFGADRILLGEYGELGPLDVQIQEEPGEYPESALNEVDAVQRLHIDVMSAIDQTMLLLLRRMLKKPEVILPHAIELATQTMRPLLEKVDTKLYTKRSRQLKVGEDYATRLLAHRYSPEVARGIAQSFVNNYADHTFIIDAEEAARVVQEAEQAARESIAPLTVQLDPVLSRILNRLHPMMQGLTAIGLFHEMEATNDPPA